MNYIKVTIDGRDVLELADKVNYLGNTTAFAPVILDIITRTGPLGEVCGAASGESSALGGDAARYWK